MIRNLLLLAACSTVLQLHGQGSVKIGAGATFTSTGAAFVVLDRMHLANAGTWQQPGGTARFTGGGDVGVSGSGTTQLHRLWLSKTGSAAVNLQTPITIGSELTFGGGLLNLGNSTVHLGSTGLLAGESETSRAFTRGSGYIEATGILAAPVNANPGNLGAIITSPENLGPTTIRRGHAAQQGLSGSGSSVERYYDILPANNTALRATLRFSYLDAELAGLNETVLGLWKSNGNAWSSLGLTSADAALNYLERKNIPSFARMTLASLCGGFSVTVPDVFAVQPGGAANTLYLGYGPTSATLSAQVAGGAAPYSYQWTAGSPAGPVVGTGASLSISPSATTTYYLTVLDGSGCASAAAPKTLTVVDVRCGPKGSKVTVCTPVKGKYTTSCVSSGSVSGLLSGGAYLGACSSAPALAQTTRLGIPETGPFTISAYPNPSAHHFTLVTSSGSRSDLRVRVTDALGREVENRSALPANGSFRIGQHYRPGVYFLEAVQGGEKRVVRLIKQPR